MKIPPSTLTKMAIVAGGVALIAAAEQAGEYLGDLAVQSSLSQGPNESNESHGPVAQAPSATPATPTQFLLRYFAAPTPTPIAYSCPACGMG